MAIQASPEIPVADSKPYALVLDDSEQGHARVLTIIDGLGLAMAVAAEMRERGTRVTMIPWATS